MKRALSIIGRAIMGIVSPSLGRKVKISDIWKTPNYEGVSVNIESPKIFFLCDKRACENCVNPWAEAICYIQDITHAKNFEKVNGDYREIIGGGD